jgi:hypothetical protein
MKQDIVTSLILIPPFMFKEYFMSKREDGDRHRTAKKQAEFDARPNVVARRRANERANPLGGLISMVRNAWQRFIAMFR